MSDPVRTGWVQPVLLSVATATALGFGFLYLTRPNAGELGAIRVVVLDDKGQVGNAIHVVVTEAPLTQKDTVSPGAVFTGVVYYPAPYLTRPNLKLTCGKRKYDVTEETEMGFTWCGRPLPGDFRENSKGGASQLESVLGVSLAIAAVKANLKPGLVFEDFAWEARGLRAPLSAIPPKTFEQKGKFQTVLGQEGVVNFEIPYATAPNVELSGHYMSATVVADCTAKGFKWRNTAKMRGTWLEGEVGWKARGTLGAAGK